MSSAPLRREAEPLRSAEDTPLLRTLLLTDLCDSTEIVEKIGDAASAQLFRQHDKLVLELQQRWRGRLIDRSDGLLLLFERPIDGLGFALDYARALKLLGDQNKIELRARAGLHVGEVLTWRNSVEAVQQGAKALEVEGLAKPMAARLMTLARPGQILLSSVAEPLVHRASRELGERGELLLWKSHGRWQFKGVPGAQEIYEVGEAGLAPLKMPKNGPKAWRDVPMWRRPASLVAEAVLCLIIGVVAWFSLKSEPAIAFGERDWVVVSDLRNLTGDPRLDDSLEQAFRISLEQSRYVNVLSDLKMRETLSRMQKPETAVVDRNVASEIAVRGGARAVILPTVSEVGGKLRVSVEVVDPSTQATVYAMSADGKGIGSALGSIDRVTGELREKLGEALQSVQKTAVPLPNVATPSLDALKAFSVARRVMDTTRDRKTALGLYQHAISLDPQFALSYADLGRLHASAGEIKLAQNNWKQALGFSQRLSSQERFYIELMLMQGAATKSYFRKADDYLALYPEDDRVLGRLATNAWHQLNDFQLAERYLRSAIKPTFSSQGVRQYSLGIFLLGQEKLPEALAAFRKSRELGYTGGGEYYARYFDMHGQSAASDRIYQAALDNKSPWRSEGRILTWLSRGDSEKALAAAREWKADARSNDDVLEQLRAAAAIASIVSAARPVDAGSVTRAFADEVRARAKEVDGLYPPTSTELLLFAGLLSAMQDDRVGLARILSEVSGRSTLTDFPTLNQLHHVLLAEQARMRGDAAAAVALLRPVTSKRTALVVAWWALERAERQAGNTRRADDSARWLQQHKGRVFAESTTTDVLGFFNAMLLANQGVRLAAKAG